MPHYKQKAWLPKELMASYWVRKVLGVLVPEIEQVSAKNYRLYHQEKLERLVAEEPQAQRVLADLLKNWEGEIFLPSHPKPPEIVALMYEHDRIRVPLSDLEDYLRGELPLQEIEGHGRQPGRPGQRGAVSDRTAGSGPEGLSGVDDVVADLLNLSTQGGGARIFGGNSTGNTKWPASEYEPYQMLMMDIMTP